MSSTRKDADESSSPKPKHRVVVGVVVALVVLVVFVLLTAFVWPGWATHSSVPGSATQAQQTNEPAKKPTIKAKALPANATELLKSMPDDVEAFARQDATDSTTWKAASPLEEHTVVYSTGTAAKNVTLIVAQWAKADGAKTQYDTLLQGLTGQKLYSGNVKVSGKNTGAYEVHQVKDNAKQAVAVWQNDTCVFQVTGPTDSVKDFYLKFPM